VTGIHSTAENLAHWIWDVLIVAELPEELLYRIRLGETEGSLVEITREERGEFVP
jgi:6-pyruvoyltetrahydropterin/6-carboxytetrahydropterin synthase